MLEELELELLEELLDELELELLEELELELELELLEELELELLEELELELELELLEELELELFEELELELLEELEFELLEEFLLWFELELELEFLLWFELELRLWLGPDWLGSEAPAREGRAAGTGGEAPVCSRFGCVEAEGWARRSSMGFTTSGSGRSSTAKRAAPMPMDVATPATQRSTLNDLMFDIRTLMRETRMRTG